jgi:RNA polymerase sigma factor (sigma-70 family)
VTGGERTKQGPVPTRRAFFGEHADKVKRVIRNRVDDPEAVEDIVQETWAAFFRSYEVNIQARVPAALLVTIAKRRVADWYGRKESRESLFGEEIVRDRLDRQLCDRLVDRTEHEVVLKVDVEQLLSTLDERQREALHLRYIDDLDPCTAAGAMGLSRTRFYEIHDQALRRLRSSPLLVPYRRAIAQKEGRT